MKATIYFLTHGNSKPEVIEYDDVGSEEGFVNMMAMALIIGKEDGTFTDKAFGYYNGTWYHAVQEKEGENSG